MTIEQIAHRLHELVEASNYNQAYDELFAVDAIAKEPQLAEMGLAEVKGIESIKGKVQALSAGIASLDERLLSVPIVTDRHIAFTNKVAATMKDGSQFQLNEICLYTVENGKIISEEFIY